MAEHIQIGAVSPRIQYTANGTQTAFTYPFPLFEETDIQVFENEIPQTITIDFTVSGAGDSSGGTVTFVNAPASGVVVTLRRNIAIQRMSDFQESGEFRAKVINDELDKLTATQQQIETDQDRSLQLGPTDSATSTIIPDKTMRSLKVLAFDSNGDPAVSALDLADIENGATSASAFAAAAAVDATAAEADAASAAASASAAVAAAALAQAAAGSGPFTTVTILTDGTHDIEIANGRTYYVCDVSGGDVNINLPAIGSDEGTTFGFEQTGSSSTVNITRDGTDTINGATSVYTLSADTEVVQFIADDNTPDNWIANIQSQTLAGTGLSKSGSTVSLDTGNANSWSAPQRGTVTTDNDGSFDMDAGNNFKWTPTGTDVLEFTNETSDQSGTILLVNPSAYAITKAVDVACGADFLATVSAAGTYLIGYYCDGTTTWVGNSPALAV